jgi:FixJ family two-component response regulator
MKGDCVLLLDDDDDMLFTLAELVGVLTSRRCVATHSLAELQAQSADAMGCSVALLDINLGPSQPSGLEAHAWLKQQHFGGRIVFLTGHARSHPMVARARALDGVEVYQKPVDADQLCHILGVNSPPGLR